MTRKIAAIAVLILITPAWAQIGRAGPAPTPAAQPAKQDARPIKSISVGTKAPALSIEKWVKGEPVTGFRPGTIYVIEFWSPGSAGSAANMPHLSELQTKYQHNGVVVVGIASKDPRTALVDVETALNEKADVIGYPIAWDAERKAFDSYVKASGSKFLPTTFIIDRTGTIAHFHSGNDGQLDTPLSEIVTGTFDLSRAVQDSRRTTEGRAGGSRALRHAMESGDSAAVLDAYEALSERAKPARACDVFEFLLHRKRDYAAASEFGGAAVAGPLAVDSQELNRIAWAIVNPEKKVERKDLDLALRAALRADELTGGRDASIIDTVARVYFWKGDLVTALELQKKSVAAITSANPPGTKTQLEATLKEYQDALKSR